MIAVLILTGLFYAAIGALAGAALEKLAATYLILFLALTDRIIQRPMCSTHPRPLDDPLTRIRPRADSPAMRGRRDSSQKPMAQRTPRTSDQGVPIRGLGVAIRDGSADAEHVRSRRSDSASTTA
jgi:hypothetical protein